MISVQVLDLDDIIEEGDLIRDIFPLSYYTQATDDEGGSTICWQYAKWKMPFWVGKTIRQYYQKRYADRPITDSNHPNEVCIVRPNKNVHPTCLHGFPIEKPPSKVTQTLYQGIIDRERGHEK